MVNRELVEAKNRHSDPYLQDAAACIAMMESFALQGKRSQSMKWQVLDDMRDEWEERAGAHIQARYPGVGIEMGKDKWIEDSLGRPTLFRSQVATITWGPKHGCPAPSAPLKHADRR